MRILYKLSRKRQNLVMLLGALDGLNCKGSIIKSCHILQGQPADIQSPTPMLEAHWETVHQHSSILFFKQAVLSLQVWPHASPIPV